MTTTTATATTLVDPEEALAPMMDDENERERASGDIAPASVPYAALVNAPKTQVSLRISEPLLQHLRERAELERVAVNEFISYAMMRLFQTEALDLEHMSGDEALAFLRNVVDSHGTGAIAAWARLWATAGRLPHIRPLPLDEDGQPDGGE